MVHVGPVYSILRGVCVGLCSTCIQITYDYKMQKPSAGGADLQKIILSAWLFKS